MARNMTNASSGPGWGGHDIVALAWLLRHPAPIVPIIGTTKQSRMTQQVRAVNVAERMTVAQWYDKSLSHPTARPRYLKITLCRDEPLLPSMPHLPIHNP